MTSSIPYRKEIWKGSAILLSLFLVFLVNKAHAQNSRVTVTADIVAPVAVGVSGGSDNSGTINFGLSLDGTSGAVDPNTSPSAGLFTITGGSGSLMNISFTSPTVTLTDSSGTNTLTFTPTVVGDTLSTDQSTAAAMTSGGHVTVSSKGSYYIWLGGNVTIPSGQAAGTYTGIFSLTVSY